MTTIGFVSKTALFAIVATTVLAVGCVSRAPDQGFRAVIDDRDAWTNLIRDAKVSDEIFFSDDGGDVRPVYITAVPLRPDVRAAAERLWAGDERFGESVSAWTAAGRSVVLVGLYGRKLKKDDLLKEGVFRIALRRGDVRLPAAKMAFVTRQWANDYFPVFSHWDRVLAVSFGGEFNPADSLTVEWPAGSFELPLFASPVSGASN
jgi:hypothetical protein